jgi:hypothetical protein
MAHKKSLTGGDGFRVFNFGVLRGLCPIVSQAAKGI